MTFEYAGIDGEGQIRKTPKATSDDASAPSWYYNYYFKDHLGSTRMVVNDDGDVLEATDYQPYGTMTDLAQFSTANPDKIREKFTGKEFDEDGVVFSQLDIDFTFDFTKIPEGDLHPLPNHVDFYFTAPQAANPELITVPIVINQETHHGSAKASFNFPEAKTIKWVNFVLLLNNEDEYFTAVNNVNADVNPEGKLTVSHVFDATDFSNPIRDDAAHTFMTYSTSTSALKVVGLRLDYFGKRYYDPDVGRWGSVDPQPQFWDMYSYCGGEPIRRFDPDGSAVPDFNDISSVSRATDPTKTYDAIHRANNQQILSSTTDDAIQVSALAANFIPGGTGVSIAAGAVMLKAGKNTLDHKNWKQTGAELVADALTVGHGSVIDVAKGGKMFQFLKNVYNTVYDAIMDFGGTTVGKSMADTPTKK